MTEEQKSRVKQALRGATLSALEGVGRQLAATTDKALAIDCPRCGVRAGEFCGEPDDATICNERFETALADKDTDAA